MRGAERKCGIPAFNCLPIGSQRHYSAGWINSQGPLVIFHRRVKRAGIVCQARPGIIMQGLLLTPSQAGRSRNGSHRQTDRETGGSKKNRKSVGEGKGVSEGEDLVGGGLIKKKKK